MDGRDALAGRRDAEHDFDLGQVCRRSAFSFPRRRAVTATATRRLVNISAAACYADVHPITSRRWVAAGRLPAYRVGPRLLKVDLNEIEDMLRPIPTTCGGA